MLIYYLGLNDSGFSSAAEDIDITEASSFLTTDSAPVRPSVGMKRPRPNLSSTANKCPRKQSGPECSQCLHLLAENQELRAANALLTEQLAQAREVAADIEQSPVPRPGKVPRAIAEHHKVRFLLEDIRQLKGTWKKALSDM